MGPIASTKTGTVQTAATMKRRHNSRWLESSLRFADEVGSGSSSIPQIGQFPG